MDLDLTIIIKLMSAYFHDQDEKQIHYLKRFQVLTVFLKLLELQNMIKCHLNTKNHEFPQLRHNHLFQK